MILRNFALSVTAVFCSVLAFGQGVYFDPAPTDVTSPGVRLYIDVSSQECNCPELLDGDPDTNPLYLWAWNPNEARPDVTVGGETLNATNGDWGNSNDNMILTQDPDDPNLWYFDFFGVSMVGFYNVPAGTFYESGIDFLVKEKNGAPADQPEQKSPDLNLIPEPLGCFEKVCPFPSTFFQDDYFVITYDNNQETNPALQNMGPDECLARFRYRVNGGSIQDIADEELGQMKFDGDGIFSITMIPQEFFGLTEGDILDEIQVIITKAPIVQPPFTLPITLVPGCPD
jgi:hypothetical protein